MLKRLEQIIEQQCSEDKSGMLNGIASILLEKAQQSELITEMLLQDLPKETMSLTKCLEKMTVAAKEKAVKLSSGKGYMMDQNEAETIIMEFYGLGTLEVKQQEKKKTALFSLEDLI